MLQKVKEQVDGALIETIRQDVWERIRTMDAGQNDYGYDPFGFEPEFLKYVAPPAIALYRHYFRVETFGIENIPESGPVLLVANHTGQIPLDGMMIATAALIDRTPPRMVRSMVERWVPSLPFISKIFARAGQVVGTRENARILLRRGGCILVFPEGQRGINKTYDRAYQLQEFGLGFMRLALATGTPIVPVSVVGAEEQMPAIYDVKSLAKLLGMPAFPITPTWPLLGPLGALPLPVKYRIYFGEPLRFEGDPDEEDRVVGGHVERVREAISQMIDRGLEERRGVFF
ncbi:acyltransferase family protein [Lujinxingia sediminis]|uniref:Acyltransferase family protein n=1 Tax=Lujinxingia sediminis TaxID=2480984 RepID=A0ABY0CS63_9DELT|nr:lysophospholipid acyltransferase family protein [Lujinxingia sediminis]RVU43499.1 acyltransferase family protein [Lujinxingia sediminis]